MKKLLAFFFVLYFLTMMPGLGWGDVAKLQFESSVGGFPLEAGKHPWYHLVSNVFETLFPFGTVAWKANFLSVLISLAALGTFYHYCLKLGLQEVSALFGTLLLGLSHTYWSLSVMAESYPLFALIWINAIGRLLMFYKTQDLKELKWGLFFLGFGMGNNLIQPAAGPAVIIATCLAFPVSRNLKFWVKPILFGLLGMSPWLLRILYAWQFEGLSLGLLKIYAIEGSYPELLFWNNSPGTIFKGFIKMGGFCLYQFAFCLLLLLRIKDKPGAQNIFLPLVIFTVMLFCSTFMPQRSPFTMLAAYVPLAFWIALCFDGCIRGRVEKFKTLAFMPLLLPVIYWVTPWLISGMNFEFMKIEKMAGRDSQRYFYQPWKHGDRSAEDFVALVEGVLSPGDTLLVDFTPSAPLTYAQEVQDRLKEINIISHPASLINVLGDKKRKGDVYLGRYNKTFKDLLKGFPGYRVQVLEGQLFKLLPAEPAR